MNENIFIPKQCKVGFRERWGTFNAIGICNIVNYEKNIFISQN